VSALVHGLVELWLVATAVGAVLLVLLVAVQGSVQRMRAGVRSRADRCRSRRSRV
jgi:hypothetical protein